MHIKNLLIVVMVTLLATLAPAENYDTNNVVVQTLAGYGIPGYVDGQGLLTAFSGPTQIVSDTASNLYVWDSGNARIRKITPNGTVTTFAGGGAYLDGFGTNASLSYGTGGFMAIDHANTIWLVMGNNYYNGYTYLVTISPNAHVSIANGGLTNLGTSSGICFDSANNLYYSGGNRIYRYTPGTGAVQAIAGSGIYANFDGQGTLFSAFNNPGALACDQADNIYVWDAGNATIRKIDQNQNVTTIAGNSQISYNSMDGVGTNATFGGGIASMFADNQGNLYLVGTSSIRKLDAQTNVLTLAGSFSQNGFANGAGPAARFTSPAGGCLFQGGLAIADTGNNRIRSITANQTPQLMAAANLQLKAYPGLQITGIIGRSYQIQSAVNPATNAWTPVATVLLSSSPYLWIDQNPVSGNKFYRALLLP